MDNEEEKIVSSECEKCVSLKKELDEKDKKLATLREDFDALERKIKDQVERNKELEFLPSLYQLYHEEYNIVHALEIYVRAVCQFSGWDVGHVYFVSNEKEVIELKPSSIWYLKNNERFNLFQEITKKSVFKSGVGLPGMIYEMKRSQWIDNVFENTNFPRSKHGKQIGLMSGFGVPLFHQEQLFAIAEFFSEEIKTQDPNLLAIVETAGEQLRCLLDMKKQLFDIKSSQET